MIKKIIISVLLVFPVFFSFAAESNPPSELLTAIVLKVLNYDRSLNERFKNGVTIGILYLETEKEKKNYAKAIDESMKSAGVDFYIRDMKFTSKPVVYPDVDVNEAVVSQILVKENISILIALTDDQTFLRKISRVTKKLSINSICATNGCVKTGIAFGVGVENDKPIMYVNLQSIVDEGSDYSGKLLSLCKQMPTE
jgi:hypothetical protein